MGARLRRGQSEVLGALAMAVLVAVVVSAAAYSLQLHRRQLEEIQGYASLVLAVQAEDLAMRVNRSLSRVEASSTVDTSAVYTAIINASSGQVLYRSTRRVSITSTGFAELYSGPYTDGIASCRLVLVAVTENGRLYTFCGLYRGFGGGSAEVPGEDLGDVEGVVAGISRLYPLLARYLDPLDYDSITRSYYPVNVSVFRLRPGYTPSAGGGQSCYYDPELGWVCEPGGCGGLVYVHLTWNSSHWVVTYRRCAADGPVLETLQVPRSSTSIPHREWLYHRECSTSNGVRHCFEVYATARGYCDWGCGDPPNSRWYFEVGMRVVYRFEPLDPGYYVLVVLNRTTYEATVGRGCATCQSYTGYPGGCVECSTRPGAGWCNTGSQQLVQLVGGPRPVVFWEVSYPQWLEDALGDDGYELGAWYPHTSVSPSPSGWGQSDYYRYNAAPSSSVSIAFHVSGVYVRDYLRRYSAYQDGYYRIFFDLIFDEGGMGYDARAWDYRVVVFLMKKLS